MAAYEVGGDSIEPRPRVGQLRPIRSSTLEGSHEELAEKIVSQVAQTPTQEPVQLAGMSLEKLTKRVRLFKGHLDEGVVVHVRVQRALQGRTQGVSVRAHAQSIASGSIDVQETPGA
jgi:hypothetical protein